MKKLFLVIDQKGIAKPFADFKEAKQAFEQMVGACKAANAYNLTFKCRFVNIEVDSTHTIKQFHANYRMQNGKWCNDLFSFQIVTL